MTYVEGFLLAVPTAKKETYVEHARSAAALFEEFGVARFVETWGDDVPRGKLNDFATAVQAKDNETVVFSWFEYPDKAARDAATARMMSDPRMKALGADMPFDAGRMIWSGFQAISDVGPGGAMGYVDGVVIPAVTATRDVYLAFAHKVADVFLEYGATRVVDAWGDDVQDGERTDFKRATLLQDGETVVFGWVEWPSKATREAAWPKLMQDSRLTGSAEERGFDGKRMIFGGFETLLDL